MGKVYVQEKLRQKCWKNGEKTNLRRKESSLKNRVKTIIREDVYFAERKQTLGEKTHKELDVISRSEVLTSSAK